MAKIHITLVGGQPAPVFNGIVATTPDKVVYIYSNVSEEVLVKLLKEVPLPFDKILLDVTSPTLIKGCAETLAQKYSGDEITVNITSGLKSWSHWFGVVFQNQENASVIYMDQNNILWNYKTMEQYSDFEFDMQTLFRLYGNSLENNFTPFANYTREDFDVITKIEKARATLIKDFNKLTTVLSASQQNELNNLRKGRFDVNESYVQWDKDLCSVDMCLKSRNRKSGSLFNFKSPNVMNLVFNAGWFEVKIAKILSGWNRAEEICHSCRFPFNAVKDKNEVDIIVNTGSKVLFVECKTQIANTTDIDKFRSVIKTYGGTGSKGLFITDSPMSEMARKKCDEHGILNFSLKEQHLGMEPEKALFLLLESELLNINAR